MPAKGSGRVRFSSERRMTTDQTARVRCWSISQARDPMHTVMTKIKATR